MLEYSWVHIEFLLHCHFKGQPYLGRRVHSVVLKNVRMQVCFLFLVRYVLWPQTNEPENVSQHFFQVLLRQRLQYWTLHGQLKLLFVSSYGGLAFFDR